MIHLNNLKNNFNVIFDTGSDMLVINSKKCLAKGCLLGNQYDASVSDTFESVGNQGILSYGSGDILVEENKENVIVGGHEMPHYSFFEILDEDGEVFENVILSKINFFIEKYSNIFFSFIN